MQTYNYTGFPLDMDRDDFERFPVVCRAGSKAPDGALIDAKTGARTTLSNYWHNSVVVLEFGSIT